MPMPMSIESRPTIRETWPPNMARASWSRPTSSVPKGCARLGLAKVSLTLRTLTALGLTRQRKGPTKQKRKSSSRKAAPPTAVRLRIKRSKMMRAWLRRFCTSSAVSARKGSTSSSIELVCRRSEMSTAGSFPLGVANTWVEDPVENISDQIKGDDKEGAQDKHGQQDRIIAGLQRLEEEQAHARPGKDALGNCSAAGYCAKVEGDDRDQGDEGVAQGMPDKHAHRADAFGACGTHIVLFHHLDHGRAQVAAPAGDKDDGEHQHR